MFPGLIISLLYCYTLLKTIRLFVSWPSVKNNYFDRVLRFSPNLKGRLLYIACTKQMVDFSVILQNFVVNVNNA